MAGKIFFELNDIQHKLSGTSKDFVDKVIFYAKESEKPQKIVGKNFPVPLMVWPSGALCWMDCKEEWQ